MVAVQEYIELDYSFESTTNIDLEFPFLEAAEGFDGPFSNPTNYFHTLEKLHPKAAFIPSLENTVFETPYHTLCGLIIFGNLQINHFPNKT